MIQEQLKPLRKEAGLTQEEVARMVGMERETYVRIERGGGTTLATFERICEKLGVRIELIKGGR